MPTKSFKVETNGETTFVGASCTAITNGLTVKVTGITQTNGHVLATAIEK